MLSRVSSLYPVLLEKWQNLVAEKNMLCKRVSCGAVISCMMAAKITKLVNYKQAFNLLLMQSSENPLEPQILWRLARSYIIVAELAGKNGNMEGRKTFYMTAREKAKKALDLDPKSADCHKWYAILLGSTGQFLSIQQKIREGLEFKKHMDEAIKLNPLDPISYYLLGRWCYAICSLSWMEKRAAAALFSTIPTCTYKEALIIFLKGEGIAPMSYKMNVYYIAKCHQGENDLIAMVEWMKKAYPMPILDDEGVKVQEDMTKQLKKYAPQFLQELHK